MTTAKQTSSQTGHIGEDIAISYLSKQGHQIISRNFHTRYGELDVITKKGTSIYFFEVKYRKSEIFGYGEESISKSKINKLAKSVEIWKSRDGRKYEYEDIYLNAIIIDSDLTVMELEIL